MRISDWSSDVCSSDLEAAQEFCSHFDLDSGCGPLIARIEQLIQARNEKDQLARANRAVDSGGKPLDLGNLALLEKTIAQADLSAMTSRQPICEVGDRKSGVEGKGVSGRVDLGGARNLKNKKQQ